MLVHSVYLQTLSYIFNLIRQFSREKGNYPKPSKVVLIVHPYNLEAVIWFGLSPGINVCTSACYPVGFIRYNDFKHDWLKVRTHTWEWNITKISETTGKHSQESYARVVRAIQLEWIFLQ